MPCPGACPNIQNVRNDSFTPVNHPVWAIVCYSNTKQRHPSACQPFSLETFSVTTWPSKPFAVQPHPHWCRLVPMHEGINLQDLLLTDAGWYLHTMQTYRVSSSPMQTGTCARRYKPTGSPLHWCRLVPVHGVVNWPGLLKLCVVLWNWLFKCLHISLK